MGFFFAPLWVLWKWRIPKLEVKFRGEKSFQLRYYLDLPPPSMQSSQNESVCVGISDPKHVTILVVTSQHAGWGVDPRNYCKSHFFDTSNQLTSMSITFFHQTLWVSQFVSHPVFQDLRFEHQILVNFRTPFGSNWILFMSNLRLKKKRHLQPGVPFTGATTTSQHPTGLLLLQETAYRLPWTVCDY